MDLDTNLLTRIDSDLPPIFESMQDSEEGKRVIENIGRLVETESLADREKIPAGVEFLFNSLIPPSDPFYPESSQLYDDPLPKHLFLKHVNEILGNTNNYDQAGKFNWTKAGSQIQASKGMTNYSENAFRAFHEILNISRELDIQAAYEIMSAMGESDNRYNDVAHGLSVIFPSSNLYSVVVDYVNAMPPNHWCNKIMNYPTEDHHAVMLKQHEERLCHFLPALEEILHLADENFSKESLIDMAFKFEMLKKFPAEEIKNRILAETSQSTDELNDCIRSRTKNYEIISRIGQGGSRKVFKATEQNLGELVSLKAYTRNPRGHQGIKLLDSVRQLVEEEFDQRQGDIHAGYNPSEETRKRGLEIWKKYKRETYGERAILATDKDVRRYLNKKEAKAMSAFDHTNVIRYSDFGVTDSGDAYIVEKYIEGSDLFQARLSPRRRNQVFKEVLLGVEHIHEEDYLHRDIKPDNVLVGNNGKVRVTDLQFAIKQDDLSPPSHRYGALIYAAPDVKRDHAKVDTRYDVFCLGATFLFTLNHDENALGEINELPKDQYTSALNQKLQEIPRRYRPFLRKSLQYHAKDRYKSVTQMKKAFAKL